MKHIILLWVAMLVALSPTRAQFVVTDPANLVSGIINSANEIIQTSSTVSNVLKNFKEVEKVFNQGKEYYDKLKAVNNLIKDARKVQQTVLLVHDIGELYVTNFNKMMQDPNFSTKELSAIAFGYSKLLQESSYLLKDLKDIISASSLSLNDKERMDVIDRVYGEVKDYYNLVSYYTRKNISVSYLRAKRKNDAQKVLDLYGTAEQKYW